MAGVNGTSSVVHRRSGAPGSVIIVGGGIAGVSCALRLAEAGIPATLLETRKKLGGRATSFLDARSGRVLDNCQHVVLGCCTNYLDLLGRLGAAEKIRWYREQYWIEEGGRTSVVSRGSLPAPAHFTMSLLRAPMLSMGEALMLARACSAIMRVDRNLHRNETFGAFLARCGQNQRIVRRFWSPVVVSACNLDVDRVAASVALHVFQEGFFASASAADIGIPSVPLVELYERAEGLITAAGGRVELGVGVESLDACSVTTTDGERLEADAVVCAVPVERVNRMVSQTDRDRDPRFAPLDRFTHSPILGVHLEFDANVFGDLPHAVLVDRPTQWLFRKNAAGTYAHAVISAADDWVPLNEEQIGERVMGDLRACLPAFQQPTAPNVLSIRPVREKLATFAPVPGIDDLRPSPVGPSGIILAGDYTNTRWPATMEGATRSGYAAAAAVLERAAREFVVPSHPIAPLARMLGLRASGVEG